MNQKNYPYSITIVGGGISGIMSASYLKTYWQDYVDITIVYDHKNSEIGVGESLTPKFNQYLDYIGITPYDIIRNCNATIKLGLKFVNWSHQGSEWIHSFPINQIEQSVDWVARKFHAVDAYDILNDCYENSYNYDHYYFDNNLIPGPNPLAENYALHIDSTVVARYIESRFKDKITILDDKIKTVNLDENGIKSLNLESGKIIKSDFYIDASGFKSILFSKLNSKWISLKNELPTNSAIPNPLFKEFDNIPPYTKAEATEDGWILDVPLSHRHGTGYTYSSDFTSDDTAKKKFNDWLLKNYNVELENDRVIRWENGYWEDQWVDNCAVIGLGSGFIEPLEATSLHNVFTQLEYFVQSHNLKNTKHGSNEYNKLSRKIYEDCFKYIRFFYDTQKNNSEFWRYMHNNKPQWLTNLNTAIEESFLSNMFIPNFIFNTESYISVMYGHKKHNKDGIDHYLNVNFLKQLAKQESKKVKDMKQNIRKYCIDHKQWITKING